MTRRQPAMAFWASVRIWVPICTGPDEQRHQEREGEHLAGGDVVGEARARCR